MNGRFSYPATKKIILTNSLELSNQVVHPATFGPRLRCKYMGPRRSRIRIHINDLEMVGDV